MKPWKTKAIAEGGTDRLWQTRRIIKPQPNGGLFWGCVGGKGFGFFDRESNKYKPRYKVGDTVYIKEALYRHPYFNEAGYLRDESPVFVNQTIGDMLKWRWKRDILTGMFMPQEAARDFVKILDVRAERLQEITWQDAIDEGTQAWFDNHPKRYRDIILNPTTIVQFFQVLWNEINPKYPWESNPWCFAYTLKVEKQ